jgi:hypothetical protein
LYQDVTLTHFLFLSRSFLTVRGCTFKGKIHFLEAIVCPYISLTRDSFTTDIIALYVLVGLELQLSESIFGFLNANHHTLIENSTFMNMQGNMGGLINIKPLLPNVTINITHCLFMSSSMIFGGVLFFDPYLRVNYSINIEDSQFIQNHAFQGGAVFFERLTNLTMRNCIFYNHSARYYGNTFASVADKLVWRQEFKKDTIQSGGTLPVFSVEMHDLFSQFVVPLSMNKDFVYVNITMLCGQNVSACPAAAATEVGKPILNEDEDSSFTKTEIIGYPGNYTLTIAPALIYDRSRFSLEKRITILPCQPPDILFKNNYEMFPRCIART